MSVSFLHNSFHNFSHVCVRFLLLQNHNLLELQMEKIVQLCLKYPSVVWFWICGVEDLLYLHIYYSCCLFSYYLLKLF